MKIQIASYDEIDPLEVQNLNVLAGVLPMTPEFVAHMRSTDPRLMPELAIYARDDREVIGQVGLIRLPMVARYGREDAGGVWGLADLPQAHEAGFHSALLEEAHLRMRSLGLRFSFVKVNRTHRAFDLYRQCGYEEYPVWAAAVSRWETAHIPTRFYATNAGKENFEWFDTFFASVSSDYLGFAWRHIPFAPLREKVRLDDIFTLWDNHQPVGYAVTRLNWGLLSISNLVLRAEIDSAEAVAAITARVRSAFVQVTLSRPVEVSSLKDAGYLVSRSSQQAMMVKPLVAGERVEDARRLYSIGSDRFLVSWLDFL